MKQRFLMIVAVATVSLTACDAHFNFPDTAVKPGHIGNGR